MVHYSTDFPNNTQRTIDELFSKATIPFSQTLYGGVSDFVEGGTEDNRNEVVFDGSSDETWYIYTESGVNQFYCPQISDIKPYVAGYVATMCDRFRSISIDNRANNYYTCYYGDGFIAFNVPNIADVSAWKTWLASNNVQVVYEKATPTTLSTPATDLKLLQDTNNLTTNGTTITLDYIPNNSIGDAVKASEEYTDRAVGRVAPKATLIDTWMISEEADTISVDLTSYDCNFFLLEYLFSSKRGTTLIPRPQGGSFSASVVTYNNGSALYIELTYNPTTKQLSYTSNITSQFGVLAIYTI